MSTIKGCQLLLAAFSFFLSDRRFFRFFRGIEAVLFDGSGKKRTLPFSIGKNVRLFVDMRAAGLIN
jgi:hypothetical protein